MDCREKNEKKAFLRKLIGGISFRGLSFRGLSFRGLRFRYTPTHQKFGNAMLMTSSLLNENPTYDFFQYIDSLHPKTKFTMETEEIPNSHSWTHSSRGIETTLFLSESTGNLHTQTNT